ncbi:MULTISPECIES: tRNA dihydrouridine(20/20a) synthase DusA [unclassified Methylophaga]|uniref:tRNA dihydrouridine(20/20a) synthase DusA n=1 Tax=unclassified Methylophaga TaxID=2629249 RepID=UPI000C8C964B|nr:MULTISPECIES: tRNA dihydrouridine(20/20a) synthase DusA [unclassified Methylophaga]MAK67927.1 tRNA dihydrouridine(20/20a) synthase DusA [Methylophaga sp.]MAY16702.1 tRNA dihydrouridine(20/20a) synthase DusA [Methylophaga sp.]HAO25812.1 tRNA dihydrouridine(20/20a) synthase DusA [Methylophaga sp.]
MTLTANIKFAHRLSLAPMLDWTDRDFRYLCRLISRHTMLYTEMVTTGALLHGDYQRFLAHDELEYPMALQLGGSEPAELAKCAILGAEAGYQEINLNVGCPSDRVQNGRFGACLMAEPRLVAECVTAMKQAVDIPITVKTRLGIDESNSYEFLKEFVESVYQAEVDALILHARKAWLKGLSPKENRDIPPLEYEKVYQIKQEFADLHLDINGGIHMLDEAEKHLQQVDGVMMGRALYHQPYLLAEADKRIFNDDRSIPSQHEIVELMLPYIEMRMKEGRPLKSITRHMLGLFQGLPGARRWRRHLSENAHLPGAGVEVVQDALNLIGGD